MVSNEGEGGASPIPGVWGVPSQSNGVQRGVNGAAAPYRGPGGVPQTLLMLDVGRGGESVSDAGPAGRILESDQCWVMAGETVETGATFPAPSMARTDA